MPVSGVTRDPLSGWYLPASAAEYASLLAGTGISTPQGLYTFTEVNGSTGITDRIGSANLSGSSFPANMQTPPGWGRTAFDVAGSAANTTSGAGDIGASSGLFLAVVVPLAGDFGSPGDLVGLGGAAEYRGVGLASGSRWCLETNDASAQPTGSHPIQIGSAQLVALRINRTAGSAVVITEYETITQSPYTAPPVNSTAGVFVGLALAGFVSVLFLHAARWSAGSAEMSDAQVRTVFNLIKYGSTGQGVTQDTTSGWYAPRDPAEWTQLLTGSGVPVPASAYNLTEPALPGQDMYLNDHLTAGTLGGFQGAFPGWSRPGLITNSGGAYNVSTANVLTGASRALLMYYGISGSVGQPSSGLNYMGNLLGVTLVSGSRFAAGSGYFGTANSGTVPFVTPGARPFLYVVNNTSGVNKYYSAVESFTGTVGSSDSNSVFLGSPFSTQGPSPSGTMLYSAVWTGSLAEMTDTQAANLLRLLQFGTLTAGNGNSDYPYLVEGLQSGLVSGLVTAPPALLGWRPR